MGLNEERRAAVHSGEDRAVLRMCPVDVCCFCEEFRRGEKVECAACHIQSRLAELHRELKSPFRVDDHKSRGPSWCLPGPSVDSIAVVAAGTASRDTGSRPMGPILEGKIL